MSSSYRALIVTRSADGYIVTVELHRPEALNAMNTEMGQDLLHCFDAFTWDTTARAVVFAGSGDKAFCVGGDLKERQGMTDEAWRAQHLIFEQAAGACSAVRCPSSRRRGLRHGRGLRVAVLSDLIRGERERGVRGPEPSSRGISTLSIPPEWRAPSSCPRFIGAPRNGRMICTGRG